jgi:hypothetical protein
MLKIGELLTMILKHEVQRHFMQAAYIVIKMSGAGFGGEKWNVQI